MLDEMIAYMELHLISLYQDAEKLQDLMSNYEYNYDSDEYEELEITDMNNTGEIAATQHLLKIAKEIKDRG